MLYAKAVVKKAEMHLNTTHAKKVDTSAGRDSLTETSAQQCSHPLSLDTLPHDDMTICQAQLKMKVCSSAQCT